MPFGVPVEGRRAARRRASDAHQDHARALPGARGSAARRPSLRTSGDHRGPCRARPFRVSRLGRRGDGATLKRLLALLLCWIALAAPAAAQLSLGSPADKLLEPEKAFRFSARALGGDAVEVRFVIAPGYYLYRERLSFSAEGNPDVRLGKADLPRGAPHKDEFFGEVQTYRKDVAIRIPVQGSGAFDLKVMSQGCADAGVCYVPMESRAHLVVAAGAPALSEGRPPAAGEARASLFSSDVEIARLCEGNVGLVLASFLGFGLLLAFTPCVLPMIPILSSIIA